MNTPPEVHQLSMTMAVESFAILRTYAPELVAEFEKLKPERVAALPESFRVAMSRLDDALGRIAEGMKASEELMLLANLGGANQLDDELDDDLMFDGDLLLDEEELDEGEYLNLDPAAFHKVLTAAGVMPTIRRYGDASVISFPAPPGSSLHIGNYVFGIPQGCVATFSFERTLL